MKGRTFGLRALDVVIIGLVLALTVVSGVKIYGGREGKALIDIESPEGHWVYTLDEDRRVGIPGPLGDTVVEIKDGHAHVLSSPCANQTCVAAPDISRKGEWNACLPNEVILRIVGTDAAEDDLDAIVY